MKVILITLLALCALISCEERSGLAWLTSFTVFSEQNVVATNGNGGGRFALGGSGTFTSFYVGNQLTFDCSRTDLLVDGPLDFTYGGVERGKVVYQNTASFNSANLGCTPTQTTPPGLVDFPTIFATLAETSTNYSQAINNGDIDQTGNTIQFIGSFPINFFTIDAATLSTAALIQVTSPVNSSVIITVTGAVDIAISGVTVSVFDTSRTLWNFLEATSVSISSASFGGAILAPNTPFSLSQATLTGSIGAQSVSIINATVNYSPYIPANSTCYCIECPPVWYLPPYTQTVYNYVNLNATENEGKLASGGNATLTSFSLGTKLPGLSVFPNVTVIGGNLTYSSGSVTGGDAIVAGTCDVNGVNFVSGVLKCDTPIEFNFTSEFQNLQFYTKYFARLISNGAVTFNFGTLEFNSDDTGLNVFYITTSQFAQASNIIINCPASSWVVINIPDASNVIQNIFVGLQNIQANRIIFNFYETTALTVTNVGVQGSVLAPLADVQFLSGAINGTLVAKSLVGSGFSQYNLAIPLHPPCIPCICTGG